MIFQTKLKVIKNNKVRGQYYKLVLDCNQIAKTAQPGQFVNIKISDDYEPLLRRPFGVHRVKGSQIEILYEVVGIGTGLLSHKKPGEYLDVLGPLGNGFELDGRTEELKNGRTILVAGGMGVAPLIFLAEKIAYSVERIADRKGKRFLLNAKRYPLNAIALIGAKTKSKILCAKEFKQFGSDIKIATDDGSKGFKGRVTELLMEILREPSTENRAPIIYSCGPHPMLKEVAKIANRFKIKAYGLLEEHMACGIGVCLGCVVKTKSGYKTVCKDGPVFDLSQIEF